MFVFVRKSILCMGLALVCQYAVGAEAGGAQRFTIGLSEIRFYPDGNSDRWIEIVNWGSNATSITGWCLSDGDGNTFKIPKEVPAVPAGGVVVVVVSSNVTARGTDLSFDKDGVISLTWIRPGTLPPYPDVAKGVCALYTDSSCAKEVAVDAVCWSFREHARDFKYPPSIANVWPEHYLISTWTREVHGGVAGGTSGVNRGSTLSRVILSKGRAYSDWFVCHPKYVSRGVKNLWLPPWVSKEDGFYGAKLLQSFRWHLDGGGEAPCWRVQIALSDRFDEPLVDAQMRLQTMLCLPKLNLAGAHLYCRARGEGHGVVGLWSEVIECDVESIEVIQDRMSDRRYSEP
jgi:Lamin Tail Domain